MIKRLFTTLAVITLLFISCKKDKDKVSSSTPPVVTTAALTNVNLTDSTLTAGGAIVSDGGASITKAGIVWSKANAMPTITDSVVATTATSGAFTVNVKGLVANATYYFRAFATNSAGTSYGEVVTPGTFDTTKVRFTYNGQQVEYGVIISPTTGKKWLDRNLGAQRVATDYNDWQAYGDLFQWGRPADGHQLINWTASNAYQDNVVTPVNGTTETLATSDVPGNSNFIIPPFEPPYVLDWRGDNNHNRWGTNPQGPCPTGWHVPSKAEWLAELRWVDGYGNPYPGTAPTGGMGDRNSAYNLLKLTAAGERLVDGPGSVNFYGVARTGYYWATSEEISDNVSQAVAIRLGADYSDAGWSRKSSGLSVRCIKDN